MSILLRSLTDFCFLQVKKLIRYLDPNTHRKINFKDFCHGVFAIKGKKCTGYVNYVPRRHSREVAESCILPALL